MEVFLQQLNECKTNNYLTEVGYEIAMRCLNIFGRLINEISLSINDEDDDTGVCLYLNDIFVHINHDNTIDIDHVTEGDIQYHNQREFTFDQIEDAYRFLEEVLKMKNENL